jgi:hypothetical protein
MSSLSLRPGSACRPQTLAPQRIALVAPRRRPGRPSGRSVRLAGAAPGGRAPGGWRGARGQRQPWADAGGRPSVAGRLAPPARGHAGAHPGAPRLRGPCPGEGPALT